MKIDEINDRYGAELALILCCCRAYLHVLPVSDVAGFIEQHDISWDRVYALSMQHKIRPIVHHVLYQVRHIVDPSFMEKLRTFCMAFSIVAFDRKRESERMLALLRENGIPARLYKGLDFAETAYGDISMREFSDMDIIIEEENIEKVRTVMKSEGYEQHLSAYFEQYPQTFTKTHKDVSFRKPAPNGRLYNFECHFRPVKWLMTLRCNFRELIGEDYLSTNGRYSRSTYFRLMVLNNGASDYYADLRSLIDLAMVYSDDPDVIPGELHRFRTLWEKLSGSLLCCPEETAPAGGSLSLDRTAAFLQHRLLSGTGVQALTFLQKVRISILFADDIRTRGMIILKAVHFLILPNGNDIKGTRLPFYSMYFFTKPLRLAAGIIKRSLH